MVVFDSAVFTWLIFVSSARAAEVKLTTPTAARPNVHLLNFMFVPPVLVCCFFPVILWNAFNAPPAPVGAFERKLVKM
jgi:hypothetical protein